MAYADDGVGSPILLVHGWAAHGGFFDDLKTSLSQKHRVLTPTLRGHPGTGNGKAPLTIETLADDIVHFIQALGLKDVVALGWSMGAMALWGAAERVKFAGLIVEDMGPRLINDATWQGGLAGYAENDVFGTLKEINADWPAYVSRFAPRMFAPSVRDAKPALVAWAANEMSKANPEAMAPFWASMAAADFRGRLARIDAPTLVIHGGDSQVYPDEATASFVANTMPRAERVVMSGAGHVPHLEAPEEFLNLVEAFARKQTRQPELRSGGVVT